MLSGHGTICIHSCGQWLTTDQVALESRVGAGPAMSNFLLVDASQSLPLLIQDRVSRGTELELRGILRGCAWDRMAGSYPAVPKVS